MELQVGTGEPCCPITDQQGPFVDFVELRLNSNAPANSYLELP